MKTFLTKLFSPILNLFEKAEGSYKYSSSHRTILVVVGMLFIGLSAIAAYFSIQINQLAGLFPTILFLTAGLTCIIVAWLGSDKAVAKIWRNRA